MARSPETEADTAVRNFLLLIEDPAQLIDHDEMTRLEDTVQSSADPLEKLRAVSRLQQLRDGDRDRYRQAFCAHAKSWAEANDIRPSSFLELGVDEDTLRDAGFAVAPRARGRSSRRRTGTGHAPVRVEQVKEAVRNQRATFTLADISEISGGSPMTIRKAVDEMIADGQVERLGPTPGWSQPGRAPIQFRPATQRARR